MRPAQAFSFLLIVLVLSLFSGACPTEDDDGDGNGDGGNGGGDAASDTGTGDVPGADEVVGTWSVSSITLGAMTLTTTNQDLGDGIQRRVQGTLDIVADGTYERSFEFFENDALTETENEGGTWAIESATIVVITETGEAPSRVQYEVEGSMMTLTRIEDTPSFEVDEMVLFSTR